MIAAVGAGIAADRPDMHAVARLDTDPVATPSRPSTGLSGTTAAAERPSLDSSTIKKTDRMQAKSRREHAPGHHHSHSSRHHKDDSQKTVGEYALHVLFTSVRALPSSPCWSRGHC